MSGSLHTPYHLDVATRVPNLSEAQQPTLSPQSFDIHEKTSLLVPVDTSSANYQDAQKRTEQSYLQLLSAADGIQSDEHIRTLANLHDIATVYQEQGQLDEAERLFSEVLLIQQRAFGQEHKDTLTTMNRIASIYYDQGRFDEAEHLFLEVVPMQKKVLGEDHDNTLSSMHKLAFIYQEQGQLDEAEHLFSDILLTQQQVLGNLHKDTLTTMQHLANTYFDQGRFEEAKELYLEVLTMQKRVFEEENEQTLASIRKLALTYVQLGQLDEVKQLLSDDISNWERIFGNEYEKLLVTLQSVADNSIEDYTFDEAEHHEQTLASMRDLALTYLDLGQLDEVKELLSDDISNWEHIFGNEHEMLLTTLQRVADNSFEDYTFDEAEHLYLQLLLMQTRTLGEEDEDMFSSMCKLALTYVELDQLDEVKQLLSDDISNWEHVFGNEHKMVFITLQRVADDYFKNDIFAEAGHLYLQILLMQKQVLGKEHKDTHRSMHDLAMTYLKQGRLDEAEQLFSDILLTQQHILGNYHNEMLFIIANLVDTYRKQGRLDKVKELRARVMRKKTQISRKVPSKAGCLGLTYPDLAASFVELHDHGCLDLTPHLEHPSFSEHPLMGGRFGDVWFGRLKNKAPVAVKTLRLHTLASNPAKNVKRVVREIYTWSQLQHNNVLSLLGIVMFQDQIAMVSPWMENGTLTDYIHGHPEAEPWELCTQVVASVEYIHGVNLIHGDIKGNNFLVSGEGIVKLSDFGNSALAAYSLALSSTNTVGGGTYRWMAPELIKREDAEAADRSKPADMYAVGMTFLEVMTGKKPYSEIRHDPGVTRAVLNGKHPRRPTCLLDEARHGEDRWNMLLSCWSMQPELRPTASFMLCQTIAFT